MTRVNKSKYGRIGLEPIAIVGPESVGEVMLIAPSMKMTRAELAGIAREKGIEVKNQTKARLIEALEK
jgi:hypothetical protein